MRLPEPRSAVRVAAFAALLLLLLLPGGPLSAQEGSAASPAPAGTILVIDTERMLKESRPGQQLLSELQEAREKLIAENRRIESRLEEEERALTEKRSEMSAAEFRELADEFDQRVQRIRDERDRAGRALERRGEALPSRFMRVVEPILARLMNETGADVMVERRAVLMVRDAADATDLAIARIDAQFGEKGSDVPFDPTRSENPADVSPGRTDSGTESE